MLRLQVLDRVLHLKGKVHEHSDRVRQSLNSAFLVAILNLVAGLAGNAELPREFRQGRSNNGISGRKLEAQTNSFSNFSAELHLLGFIVEVLPGWHGPPRTSLLDHSLNLPPGSESFPAVLFATVSCPSTSLRRSHARLILNSEVEAVS